MDLDKLERSLLKRVVERVQQLLPEATVREQGGQLAIQLGSLEGQCSVRPLAEACLRVDRTQWGGIAGSYCQVIVRRAQEHSIPPMEGDAVLAEILPTIVPCVPEDDALIMGATPSPGLQSARVDWLPGWNIEFVRMHDGNGQRVRQCDVEQLDVTVDAMRDQAIANLKERVPELSIEPVGDDELSEKVMVTRGGGVAMSMLLCPEAHHRMFTLLSMFGDAPAKRILAVAPRTNVVFFADMKEAEAVALMVSMAWQAYENDAEPGVPVSPHIVIIKGDGDIDMHDVGLGTTRLTNWFGHALGSIRVMAPNTWEVSTEAPYSLRAPSDECRVDVTLEEERVTTPYELHQRAREYADEHAVQRPIGYGFFHALPWAWVDRGLDEEDPGGAMFVGLPGGLATFETHLPPGGGGHWALTVRKILATVTLIGDSD